MDVAGGTKKIVGWASNPATATQNLLKKKKKKWGGSFGPDCISPTRTTDRTLFNNWLYAGTRIFRRVNDGSKER